MIRPKQNDLDLLGRLIDLRDSARLAGHTDDPFRLFDFNGTESVLYGPERNEGQDVSTMGMRRLQDLGLLHVIDVLPKGFTFDLVDDVRDRLEEMRVALGQPSRLGEIEAAKERAEAAQRDLETRVRESVASRAASRRRLLVTSAGGSGVRRPLPSASSMSGLSSSPGTSSRRSCRWRWSSESSGLPCS